MKYNDLLEVLDSEYSNHPEVKVITNTLEETLPKRQKPLAHMHWLEFVLKHGSYGAKGLIGFVQFYKDHDKVLSETICHDIFGRNDVCFLPRSSGYDKYYEGVQNAN